MKAVIQRVTEASVKVDDDIISEIHNGFLVLLGVGKDDTEEDAQWLARKIAHLRVFEDDAGKMNLSLEAVGGEILSVSQFTLYADCKKSRRPSFSNAAGAEMGHSLYNAFNHYLRAEGVTVKEGQFQAHMQISLINDGPVTLTIDTKER